MTPTVVWFRQDLRLQDNPALAAALERGGPIIPLYILDDAADGKWKPGAASRQWLHRSLAALDTSLRERGSRLVFARGDSAEELRKVLRATGATALLWNRRYEPAIIARDAKIKSGFSASGVDVKSFSAALLNEPHTISNKQGRPFQVFSPFWRHCLGLPVSPPAKLPRGSFPAPTSWPKSVDLDSLDLRVEQFVIVGEPGEAGAAKRLKEFVGAAVDNYSEARDFPAVDGTSRLSPHLHFGEVGPHQIWAAMRHRSRESGIFPPNKGAAVLMQEIGWREFAYHLLFHFPRSPDHPLREDFSRFPWAGDPTGEKLRAWQTGRTGYPIVDAGMRQLSQTGWMHNRVRMIVASFLVKHLRLSWQHGAEWFWDNLVDADLANNTLGWQWSAGCGADAAPYFRIFAPVLQGGKFDAAGEYVRRWVPELTRLPNENIHAPWEAAPDVMARAGVQLGRDYPAPIVDHATARAEALAALKQLRSGRPG